MRRKMYTLITDETNTQQSEDSKFFIYGGCIIPQEKCINIHRAIMKIRQNAGFPDEQEFKFDSRSRPKSMSKAIFTEAKRKVVDLAIKENVTFLTTIVHHEIAKNKNLEEKVLYSLKTIIAGFHRYLQMANAYGQVISDRINGIFDIHKEIVTQGLDPSSDSPQDEERMKIKLDRIWQLSVGTMGSGHLMSLVDIVLGSFRYCINYPDRDASKEMYPNISKLLLRNPSNHSEIEEWGLLFRPKNITISDYKKDYEELRDKLRKLGESLGDQEGEEFENGIPF